MRRRRQAITALLNLVAFGLKQLPATAVLTQ